jgi:glycosyltransferase involved in cell wall biosynthesis
LFPVIANAECSVLPSRVDNLPNTVIESLMLQTPVIAFRAASIDEIVQSGMNGQLVEYEDICGLAQTMVDIWNRRVSWTGDGFQRPALFAHMTPAASVQELLEFVSHIRAASHRR